ncbi:protein Shroom3 [Ctenodactylus gundi]
MMQVSQGTLGPPWHQSYHPSSSTSDLSNYDHAYLRQSPDQCSSQGSMESLEPSGGYPPCHLLSPAKSTSSIDQLSHLHNKRDSAYSSFSTSSSILEYPPPGSSGRECSGSMDTNSARGGLLEGMRQADIRYVKTVYDTRRGVSAEYEVNSSALLHHGRESQAAVDGLSYDRWHSVPRGKGAPSSSWSQQCPSSLEPAANNLPHKVGAPLPPARSDSYAAFRQQERPSSWSSHDQKRLCRPPANSSGSLKSLFIEEPLHTVQERSPENSPPVKPKNNYTQKAQPGQPLLPTGIYPVPSLEPHFAQVPQASVSSNGTLYPALAKESGYTVTQEACSKVAAFDENGNQNGASRPGFAFYQPVDHDSLSSTEKKPETVNKYVPYKVHFSSVPENEEDSALNRHLTPLLGNSPHPSERKSIPSNRPCSNLHSLKSSQAQAWQVGEDKRSSRLAAAWEGDFQEDHNANLQPKLEREDVGQSLSGSFGRTRSAFSSLQNIPESLRRQSSLEVGGVVQEGYPGGRPTYTLNTKVEEPGRKVDLGGHLERPVSYPRPEGRTSASASFYSSDPSYEEPPSPPHQQTPSLGRRRLSSGGASALQSLQCGQPHCSVLEKVSKFEQREQGGHRPPGVGIAAYGQTSRPGRMVPASRPSEEAKPSVRFSESAEAPSSGEQQFKNGDPKLDEVSWPPCGQQLRRAAEGGRGGEPPRPDARLRRSQSSFQLSGEAEGRPRTPESPPPDAPFRRAYRNSIKDAQSRVLGATSFRRRDLEPGVPPAASRPWRPRPASAHVGPRSSDAVPAAASPHAPRERHSVTPAQDTLPAPAARRGPRRRLTLEQKKRSYSEPEKMNEVGVAEEAGAAPRRGPPALGLRVAEGAAADSAGSVADRRRVFERDGRACSTLSLSGPELRQFQQSALADYVQRKTGRRPSLAAACGTPELALRERAQGARLLEGPGLAPARSLGSLRDPGPPPRLEAALPPPAATEPPRAPRDRSSSFAGGRLPGDRRRGDPQASPAQSEPRGGTSSGPGAIQRVDRPPGPPSAWGAVAGKSMSAEDLLERSDVLAAPVHVRSRSSPTADKKRQAVLLGEDDGFGLVKDPYYLAGLGSRSLSCSERGPEEKPSLIQPPSPRWSGSGCRVTGSSSVPSDHPGALDHQRHPSRMPRPKPQLAGAQGPTPDTRAAPLTPPASPGPSPVPSSNSPQLTTDQQTRTDSQVGLQPLAPYTHTVTHRSISQALSRAPSPGGCKSKSSEQEVGEETQKRASLPRQPPPWVKWGHAVAEGSPPEEAASSEVANPKHFRKQLSFLSSCSTLDPDTPGRISLRISESGLRASPTPREDYDDEVFVKNLPPKATSSSTFESLSLPPPPPDVEIPVNSPDVFPPPPSQAVFEAPIDSETPEGPGSSSSKIFKVAVTRERHASDAAHFGGSQILVSRPHMSLRGSEASESNPPAVKTAELQLGSLGKQPSPGQPLPNWTQSLLLHEPVSETQGLEKKVSSDPQKTSEDIRTEALAKEIVHQDKSLADILDPDSRMKTTMDLMEGLFPRDVNLMKANSTKRKAVERPVSCTSCEGKRGEDKEAVGMFNCPAYYSVSAAKAELLNKIKDMPAEVHEEEEHMDVNEKKAELIESLTHKLETLQEAKGSLLMDIKLNNALGEEVEAVISELCKPNEFDKYKMFIGDLDKVVNLLLSLSGRLARVENVLSSLGEDASDEERSSLNEKRKILASQHEDARELKENLDRRERVVLDILANYLTADQLQDYQHFVKMKSTLLIEQRKLDDKMKLGQEQVKCLLESLPSDFAPKAGPLALPPGLGGHSASFGGSTVSSVFPTLTSPL